MNTKERAIVQSLQLCFIEPMYAEAVHELPDGGAWSYEAKLDGYRCLAMKRSSPCSSVVTAGDVVQSAFPGDRPRLRESPS